MGLVEIGAGCSGRVGHGIGGHGRCKGVVVLAFPMVLLPVLLHVPGGLRSVPRRLLVRGPATGSNPATAVRAVPLVLLSELLRRMLLRVVLLLYGHRP